MVLVRVEIRSFIIKHLIKWKQLNRVIREVAQVAFKDLVAILGPSRWCHNRKTSTRTVGLCTRWRMPASFRTRMAERSRTSEAVDESILVDRSRYLSIKTAEIMWKWIKTVKMQEQIKVLDDLIKVWEATVATEPTWIWIKWIKWMEQMQ